MKKLLFTLGMLFLFAGFTFGQDLVYKPKNPNFGGDTFNYNWLLSSAQAQDDTVDPRSVQSSRNGLEDITESLNRQLLNQLSRQIATTQFGEEGLEDGNYTIGNFQIDVNSTLDGLSIRILDNAVGDQTEIFIPFF